MTNKKTVSSKYAKKQFSITGIVLMLYALLVLYIPYGIKMIINFGLFSTIDSRLYFIICLICLIAGTVFPFFILRKVFGIGMKELNTNPDIRIKDYLANFVVYFGFAAAALYINNILSKLIGAQSGLISDVGIVFNEKLAANPVYLIAFVILSPILEEYAFRGVLLNSLSKYGKSFALFMTTLIYSIAHGYLGEIFPSLIMGYILTKMALTYKTIRPSLVTHILSNAFLCFLTLMPSQANYVSLIIIGVLLAGAIFLFLSKRYHFITTSFSPSSKEATKLFLSNIFVIFAMAMFIVHSIIITFLKL